MSPVRPYRSRLLLPETLPFTDARERRWFYNYRGAGGLFTPAQLSGVAFWGTADSAAVDGSNNLTAWPSLLGSVSGTPSTSKPTVVTVNGKKWVRFTAASSQYVTVDALAALLAGSDTPYTVAVSLKLATTASQSYFSACRASGSAQDARLIDSGGFWHHTRRDDASATVQTAGAVAVSAGVHILVDTFGGTTTSHYSDGAAGFENQPCDVGALSLDSAVIGCRIRNAVPARDIFLDADVRQFLLIVGRVLTAVERARLTEYLAADAGVSLS